MSKSTTLKKSRTCLDPQPYFNDHHDYEHQLSSVDIRNPPSTPILATTSTSSLSPTLSSSVSSLNSLSSSSSVHSSNYSTNDSTPVLPDVRVNNQLQTHTSLLRIVLQTSLAKKFGFGQWQRLDLKVVDEYGMGREQARTWVMGISCELLEREGTTTCISRHWQIDWRPLRYDAWHWTNSIRHSCGFDKSGVGGLEFKVLRQGNHQSASARIKKMLSTQLYIRIVPTFDHLQTIHALPLVVGPFTVVSNDNNAWQTHTSNTDYLQAVQPATQGCSARWSEEMYRAFQLGDLDRYFLIKEGWDMGTSGKLWDSASVISDLLVQKIIQHPTCFRNLHILDLSAGTGTTGLLIHYLYKHMFPDHYKPRITLTDLPTALPLIFDNKKLNGMDGSEKTLSVVPLAWGHTNHIRHIQTKAPIDIIIASDVLYQPANFGTLVSTLVDLSEPGRTVIYLGYKRRGLKGAEEQLFFDLCYDHFDIQMLGYEEGEQINLKADGHHRNDKVGWESQYGKLLKNEARMDGEGWLGPFARKWYGKDVSRQAFQGVLVYRLVRKQH